MSDILIKGMEMPSKCCECRLSTVQSFKDRPLCDVLVEYMSYGEWETKRLDNCPLIPVPPHGRLIAEDDAIKTAWMILEGLGYRKEENKQLEQTVREVFATAPAIEVK